MAEVIHSLQGLPDADLLAMSVYLASLVTPAEAPDRSEAEPLPGAAAQTFRAACSSCHEPGLPGAETAAQVPLSMSAAIRATRPEAVKTVIRDGIAPPLSLPLRDMPGFADELGEAGIDDLARYLRARYAPDLPPWR